MIDIDPIVQGYQPQKPGTPKNPPTGGSSAKRPDAVTDLIVKEPCLTIEQGITKAILIITREGKMLRARDGTLIEELSKDELLVLVHELAELILHDRLCETPLAASKSSRL